MKFTIKQRRHPDLFQASLTTYELTNAVMNKRNEKNERNYRNRRNHRNERNHRNQTNHDPLDFQLTYAKKALYNRLPKGSMPAYSVIQGRGCIK
jgi:hypothetical protein